MTPTLARTGPLLLRLAAAAGLGYDALVHLRLAANYDAVGTALTQGELFRIEAAAATVTAIAVLLTDRRRVWAAAGIVGLAGVVAVLVYRYLDLPPIGPVPKMYEPVWYPDKAYSAVAEAVVVLTWLARQALPQQPPVNTTRPGTAHATPNATPTNTAGP